MGELPLFFTGYVLGLRQEQLEPSFRPTLVSQQLWMGIHKRGDLLYILHSSSAQTEAVFPRDRNTFHFARSDALRE